MEPETQRTAPEEGHHIRNVGGVAVLGGCVQDPPQVLVSDLHVQQQKRAMKQLLLACLAVLEDKVLCMHDEHAGQCPTPCTF